MSAHECSGTAHFYPVGIGIELKTYLNHGIEDEDERAHVELLALAYYGARLLAKRGGPRAGYASPYTGLGQTPNEHLLARANEPTIYEGCLL